MGGKSDFKVAYRRVCLHGDTAAKYSIMYKDLGLPSLQLILGGSPCWNEFCVVFELCTDLANDILHYPHWDPDKVHSPHSHVLSAPALLDDSVTFGQAKEEPIILGWVLNTRLLTIALPKKNLSTG